MPDAMLPPTLKLCSKCKIDKPLSAFYKSKLHRLGVGSHCKLCTNSTSAKNYSANRAELLEKSREWAKANRESKRASYAKWKAANPIKKKASDLVNSAIKTGRMVRQPCEICGTTKGVHGHHCDYSKPLDVMWLCPAHHTAWHADNGPGLNG